MSKYFVDPDIRVAETLPGAFYTDQAAFDQLIENVFSKSWHWLGDHRTLLPSDHLAHPIMLGPNSLDEPLVLISNQGREIKALSNVCTHRANIIVDQTKKAKKLVCNYHGRQWDLNGKFLFMPEFRDAQNFPRPCDHLKSFPIEKLGEHLFVSLDPLFPFSDIEECIMKRMYFMDLSTFKEEPQFQKSFSIHSHWSLYCDNYLEGFHIPFIHPTLNTALDYGSYSTHLYPHMVLQIGYGKEASECFDLPEEHPDHGKLVAAYYYWIFPNLMLNFYPWGLSVNVVEPQSIHETRILFRSFVYDALKLEQGAGVGLDQVELEDEAVVESVHRGVQSRAYSTGRFSPSREQGVHHFHRMLSTYIN